MQGTAGVGWTETITLLISHSYAGARRIARAVLQPTPASGSRVTRISLLQVRKMRAESRKKIEKVKILLDEVFRNDEDPKLRFRVGGALADLEKLVERGEHDE